MWITKHAVLVCGKSFLGDSCLKGYQNSNIMYSVMCDRCDLIVCFHVDSCVRQILYVRADRLIQIEGFFFHSLQSYHVHQFIQGFA